MVLAALTLFSFVFTIKVPGIPAKISVSETFVFTSVLLFGTAAATATVALDALIMSGWRHRREPLKVLFNATEPALSIWLASQLFFVTVDLPRPGDASNTNTLLLPVLLLSLTYFFLNSSLTAIAIGLETGSHIVEVWRTHFFWLALNYLGGASVALLIVQHSSSVNIATISVILPLLVITYLTFKSSMGRIEDADRHVDQINHMYMSTIETLAMAIDAKDQTTHGHIRRVQRHAVGLARALGMNEAPLIRAIEAAALLHDVGKLGVPEHILNKPGRLSATEFTEMKAHAALGAEILSATEFPYPIVPIVRHHHENWDGSGYPDGLAGVDIPIGARLLAVVDCFDALTSDRPYRQRMSRTDALTILRERRAFMYDPLIVDTFIECIRDIVGEDETPDSSSSLSSLPHDGAFAPTLHRDHEPSRAQRNAISTNVVAFGSAALRIAQDLSRCVPDAIVIVYRLEEASNELAASYASKQAEAFVGRIRIHVPHRLSGWVAANRQTIVNSDPRLDSPELSTVLSLKYALCTPISSGTIIFGVLAVYRATDRRFSVEETNTVESLSRTFAAMLTEYVPKPGELVPTRN
jgi:putative nucleotidyltransferase with HDIG domain